MSVLGAVLINRRIVLRIFVYRKCYRGFYAEKIIVCVSDDVIYGCSKC